MLFQRTTWVTPYSIRSLTEKEGSLLYCDRQLITSIAVWRINTDVIGKVTQVPFVTTENNNSNHVPNIKLGALYWFYEVILSPPPPNDYVCIWKKKNKKNKNNKIENSRDAQNQN